LRFDNIERESAFDLQSINSSFATRFRRLFVISHGDEGAMAQVTGIRPFDEGDLAD
jgi:hypothetical protein